MPQHSVLRVAENSLASLASKGQRERRLSSISQIPNPIKRFGAFMIDGLVSACPSAANRLIGNDSATKTITYLGAGADHIVFLNGQDVIKIHVKSLAMLDQEKKRLRSVQQERYSIMAEYIGPFMLDQIVDIGPHPKRPNQTGVRTVQPFCDFVPINVFTPHSLDTNVQGLDLFLERYPNLARSLIDLVNVSMLMYQKTGLAPDLTGIENVVVSRSESRLLLIDGQPIDHDSSLGEGHKWVLTQAEYVASRIMGTNQQDLV